MNNKIKNVKSLLVLFMLTTPLLLKAQITNIPDNQFEQQLIDLNIDSDGIINGQVLTSDINTVLTLGLNDVFVQDLTGIEDFTALEFLDVSGNPLEILDVSNNIQLKELYCISSSGGVSMLFADLDLSNNPNLEVLYGENLFFLENLNLKNGNNQQLTVVLPCKADLGIPCDTQVDCVIVDDEDAANSDQPPYNTWFIQADFTYSEDCILDTASNKDAQFSVYPNPASDKLTISALNNSTEQLNITIYTLQGAVMQSQKNVIDDRFNIDVSALASGVYFVAIKNTLGHSEILKFIKE